MKRSFLLSLCFAPLVLCAQTYFYIDNITVTPAAPTTSDPITITVSGNLASSNAYIVSASHSVVGSTVQITIVAAASGIGLPVLTPHSEVFNIGILPPGTYMIVISGTAILDSAPSPQHLFTVSGSGGSPCDSLVVDFVQWAPFSDTALVLHVYNNGLQVFGYPSWILFNDLGDTLAAETVTFFGIVGESFHTLTIRPGAVIPVGTFTATLELWTDFYTNLACTFNWTGDLCPPGTCTELYPTVYADSSATFPVTIPWSIVDAGLISMGSGTFTLSGPFDPDADTVCLPPGHYTLITDPTLTPDSTVVASLTGPGNTYSNFGYNINDGYPEFFAFTLYEQCIDSTTTIGETTNTTAFAAWTDEAAIHIRGGSDALGTIELFSGDGRVIERRSTSASAIDLPIGTLAPGIYLVRCSTAQATARVLIR